MNQAHELFRLAYAAKLALVGGRAPRCWRRDLARSKERLSALRRSCGWVESLLAPPPVLHVEPLMGCCLALLTNQHGRPAKLKREASRSRRPRFTWSERLPGQVQERAARPHRSAAVQKPHLRRAASSIFSLQAQAARELLSRLAGEAAGAVGTSRPLRRLPSGLEPRGVAPPMPPGPKASEDWLRDVAQRSEPSANQLYGVHASHVVPLLNRGQRGRGGARVAPQASRDRPSPRVNSPSSSRHSTVHKDWLRDVARRVQGRFSQEEVDLRASQRALPESPWHGETPSLAEQWLMQLNGPAASAELLARLAGTAVADNPTSLRDAQPKAVLQGSAGSPSAGLSVSQAPTEAHSSPMMGLSPTPGEAVIFPPVLESWIEDGGGKLATPARIALPTVASPMPPLVPPHAVGGAVPPVAAITARRGARAEATPDEGDLSLLAARIKRILDEEARRHGIDV